LKKLLTLLFCILLLIPLALAVPPFVQTAASTTTGLDIRSPQGEFLEQGASVISNIHVFNKSNGMLMTNTTTSCLAHIYNKTGGHLAEEDYSFSNNGIDFELSVDGNNFSQVGIIIFIIQCNTSNVGGFVSGSFRVTVDGEDDTRTDTSPGVSATIFLLFITTLLFLFPFLKDFSKHKWANNIIKRAFWTVGIFVLMWNASILATIAENANLDIVSHFLRYMMIFGWAGYVAAAYLVLKSLFEMIATYRIHKEEKRFGKKGGNQGGF